MAKLLLHSPQRDHQAPLASSFAERMKNTTLNILTQLYTLLKKPAWCSCVALGKSSCVEVGGISIEPEGNKLTAIFNHSTCSKKRSRPMVTYL